MNSTVSIRDYGIGDLISMFRLDELCFAPEFRFDPDAMREFAEAPGAIVRIAEGSDGVLGGFVIVHVEEVVGGLVGYVVTLDVAEQWRRRGVAAMLMRDVERRATEAGALQMGLHVFTGNDGAIRFYEKMGYERAGIRRRFYGQARGAAGLDAFVYRKRLA